MDRTPITLALALATSAPVAVAAAEYHVDPEAGNSTLAAVFDAALGERITAQSSAVSCEVTYDAAAGVASGRCAVPLASIVVDADETKSEHFHQWATNRKSDPAACRLEARFENVAVGRLERGKPAAFEARLPFTVCGRGPTDGRTERLKGTALLFAPGEYGASETIRVRAAVEGFDREAYRIGPGFTEGWFARVQSLAKVVAKEGRIDLSLFARAAAPAPAAAR